MDYVLLTIASKKFESFKLFYFIYTYYNRLVKSFFLITIINKNFNKQKISS